MRDLKHLHNKLTNTNFAVKLIYIYIYIYIWKSRKQSFIHAGLVKADRVTSVGELILKALLVSHYSSLLRLEAKDDVSKITHVYCNK